MKHLIKTTLLLLAILMPALALAHDFEVDGIYYNINGDNASVTKSPYNNKYSGDIIIPANVTWNSTTFSVTAIEDYAFSSCTGLTSIVIPNSVTKIGGYAFSGCTGLTSIEIPNSVSSIGYNAFNNTPWYNRQPNGLVYAGMVAYKYKGDMPNGTSITLNEGTLGIAGHAFANCTGLTGIEFPNSLITIGDWAFYGCSGLTSIEIPNSVTSMEYRAFSRCTGLTSVEIPNSITTIGVEAFSYCTGLTSIEIPNSVTTIGGSAFWGCTGLTSIEIPNSVTSIGGSAFSNCTGLTSIQIPNSVTSIGGSAFSSCTGLTSIEISNSVTSIGDYAFSGCTGLTSIEIPSSVIAIGETAFYNTAWYNNQPDGVVYAGFVAYEYKGKEHMPSGTSIVLKDGTVGIGDFAFGFYYEDDKSNRDESNDSLTNIIIPNSVINIGEHAFQGCYGLTSIMIPNSVTTIGNCAFYDCTGLTSINIGNSVSKIGTYAFDYCDNVTNINSYATSPPVCTDWIFTSYSATLHVPAASVEAYSTAPVWSKFETIVGDAVVPTGIDISRDSVDIQLGEPFELTATVNPANASSKDVFWYSTNTDVATVENGIVTTVGVGECDIIAYCMGMPAICHVTVINQISIGQQEAMVLPNHMLTLTPSAPVMPNGFTATSSDPTVASVEVMNGQVQVVGIKEGTTTITVESADGTASPAICLVTVYTELGDVNCDGFNTISDVTQIIDYLLGNQGESFKAENADFNGDGDVNIKDVTDFIDMLLTLAP